MGRKALPLHGHMLALHGLTGSGGHGHLVAVSRLLQQGGAALRMEMLNFVQHLIVSFISYCRLKLMV